MGMIEDYINEYDTSFYLNGGKYWYVGLENTVDKGIKMFLSVLNDQGEILLEDPIITSFIENEEIHYVIVLRSLPKLKYLEYKYKNG